SKSSKAVASSPTLEAGPSLNGPVSVSTTRATQCARFTEGDSVAQPALGLLSSAIVMAIALAFLSLFDFPTFAGWVAFIMLGLIPMQVVAVVLWGANPPCASSLRQPVKGIVLVLVTVVATAVLSPLIVMTVGEGMTPPGPIPSHYVIIVVPTTFWLAIMMGGWPFTKVS